MNQVRVCSSRTSDNPWTQNLFFYNFFKVIFKVFHQILLKSFQNFFLCSFKIRCAHGQTMHSIMYAGIFSGKEGPVTIYRMTPKISNWEPKFRHLTGWGSAVCYVRMDAPNVPGNPPQFLVVISLICLFTTPSVQACLALWLGNPIFRRIFRKYFMHF